MLSSKTMSTLNSNIMLFCGFIEENNNKQQTFPEHKRSSTFCTISKAYIGIIICINNFLRFYRSNIHGMIST